LDTFRSYSNTPFVIGANKQDDEDAWPPDDLKIALGLDHNVRVLPCVATQKESVKSILLELLYVILENAAEEPAPTRKK
jgi:signal recognition particle receptor subunit beta